MSIVEAINEIVLITPKQAAKALNVSERTINAWMTDGLIPNFKIGGARRIELAAIKTLIRDRAAEAAKSLYDSIVERQTALEKGMAG
jgi:excisionase family DNA binding protein